MITNPKPHLFGLAHARKCCTPYKIMLKTLAKLPRKYDKGQMLPDKRVSGTKGFARPGFIDDIIKLVQN